MKCYTPKIQILFNTSEGNCCLHKIETILFITIANVT